MIENLKPIEMKRVVQIGIVVRDVEQAMNHFCRLFQVPENRKMIIEVKEGENSNFSAYLGWVNIAGIQFEFIQPNGGDDKTYTDFLEKTGGGIHHIMFLPDNAEEILFNFRESGIPEITPGSFNGKVQDPTVGYFDLHQEMGMNFEISTKNIDHMTTLDFDQLFKRTN